MKIETNYMYFMRSIWKNKQEYEFKSTTSDLVNMEI